MLIKTAFKLTYRQTEGKLKGVISLIKDKDLKIPDYTSIAKRAKYVMKELDKELKKIDLKKDNCHVLVDSSGLKIMGSNEWSAYKKAKEKRSEDADKPERKAFIKLHICIDAESQKLLSYGVTADDTHDARKIIPLVKEAKKTLENTDSKIDTISADGAYHWNEIMNYLEAQRIDPLIPLPKNAVLSKEYSKDAFKATPRDALLLRQYDLGGLKSWKKLTKYHERNKVETFFSRFKTIFKEKVYSKKPENIHMEIALKLNLLNKFKIPSQCKSSILTTDLTTNSCKLNSKARNC